MDSDLQEIGTIPARKYLQLQDKYDHLVQGITRAQELLSVGRTADSNTVLKQLLSLQKRYRNH
jgi:hypothetical protein